MKIIFDENKKRLFLLPIALTLGIGLVSGFYLLSRTTKNVESSAETARENDPVLFPKPRHDATESNKIGSIAKGQPAISPSASRLLLTKEESRFATQAEDYLRRLVTEGVSNDEASAMGASIQMALQDSPRLREHFAKRLERAFQEHDTHSVFELERAFTMSKEVFDSMLPIYKDIIDGEADLDYYAIQTLGYMQPWLSDADKQEFLDRSVEQLNRYSNSDQYAGPLGYINRAAKDPEFQMSESQRHSAVLAVRSRMESASSPPAQYATARALYNLSSPQDASALAQDLLNRPPNLGYLHATLGAMATGRLPYQPSMVLAAARMFESGQYQGDQADTVIQLLEVLRQPLPTGG